VKTKRPAHLGQAIADLVWLTGKRLNGPRHARQRHVHRMKAIIRYAYRCYQIGPHQIGIKHLRSFLDRTLQREGLVAAHDYFQSVYQLVWLLGKANDWLPRLYGPWGRPEKKGELPPVLCSERAPTPPSGPPLAAVRCRSRTRREAQAPEPS
jgi:hypothetical protein